MKQHINRHIHTLSEQVRWAAFEYRFRRSKLHQWIIRKCMPEIHRNHADLLASNGDWQSHCHRSQQTIDNLCQERAHLTEIVMSLVAKDDDGMWTTVFNADTRLPKEMDDYLTRLAARA